MTASQRRPCIFGARSGTNLRETKPEHDITALIGAPELGPRHWGPYGRRILSTNIELLQSCFLNRAMSHLETQGLGQILVPATHFFQGSADGYGLISCCFPSLVVIFKEQSAPSDFNVM